LLLCHALDSDRVIRGIQGWLNDGTLKVSKKLCVCEWSTITSTKSVTDVILVKQRFGSTNCDELDDILQENIVIDIQKILVEYEKSKFTRKEPPVEYTMQELWLNAFTINPENKDFETTIDEVLKTIIEYYVPWSNVEGEYSQVRRNWVRKAMEGFCSIGLAERNESEPDKFRIFRGKQIKKDILDYMVEGLCSQTVKDAVKKMFMAEEKSREQKGLFDFPVNSDESDSKGINDILDGKF
jgi:hypothetical protein